MRGGQSAGSRMDHAIIYVPYDVPAEMTRFEEWAVYAFLVLMFVIVLLGCGLIYLIVRESRK